MRSVGQEVGTLRKMEDDDAKRRWLSKQGGRDGDGGIQHRAPSKRQRQRKVEDEARKLRRKAELSKVSDSQEDGRVRAMDD